MPSAKMPKGVTMREATGSESARRLVGQAREFIGARDAVYDAQRAGNKPSRRAQAVFDEHVRRIEGMGTRGQEMWSKAVRLAQRGRK